MHSSRMIGSLVLLHFLLLQVVLSAEEHPVDDSSIQIERGRHLLRIISKGGIPNELGLCEGDCDFDTDCQGELVCFHHAPFAKIPGCEGGESDASKTDYCVIPDILADGSTPLPTKPPTTLSPTIFREVSTTITFHGADPPPGKKPLSLCEGDCDRDSDCKPGLRCFQRSKGFVRVPGCANGELDPSKSDYCIATVSGPTPSPPQPSTSKPTSPPENLPTSTPQVQPTSPTSPPIGREPEPLQSFGGSPPRWRFPLPRCAGDCDSNADCQMGMICFQRDAYDPVPGCIGIDPSKTDYCLYPSDLTGEDPSEVTGFTPGKLTVQKHGLLLSEGLDVKLIAISGDYPIYHDGSRSKTSFHFRPDAGATFPDPRPSNVGGFIYVSNSEMFKDGEGGVGSLTFDSEGNLIDYKMVLEGSTMNCGGGRTPWNTWASCEEKGGGQVWHVDPLGERTAEIMTIGKSGGAFESFAYDIRNKNEPHFFITEDSPYGALRRFTPDNPDWSSDMLHGPGEEDYLVLWPDRTGKAGTFSWTSSFYQAILSAEAIYPNTEGIDCYGDQLFFVSKVKKEIFTLNLDDFTWYSTSTVSGLFDGQPDQLQRLLGDSRDLLYFTEEGGRTGAGIHARDSESRFYTIVESVDYASETTGLSLSPDGRFMFVAYQNDGLLFCLFRRDGLPFQAEHLDVKYHTSR